MAFNKREIHAHFDCFGGATLGALLAACLHACDDNELLDDLQTTIQEGLPELGLNTLRVSQSSANADMSETVVHVLLETDNAPFHLPQICSMLASAKDCISELVLDQVLEVFTELMQAENTVHGRSHDQGNVSASCIVKVVATLLVLHKLHVKTASCSPLPLGEGSTWTEEQGLLPIPSPVTLQLLIGMPTCPGPLVESDLITPTAAALLRILTRVNDEHGPTKRPCYFTMQSIGVGMDGGSESRILRVLLGESIETNATVPGDVNVTETHTRALKGCAAYKESDSLWNMDELTRLEANLDDMPAEALAFAVELLLEKGALDAWVVPIVMKKGRAGHTLSCLCRSNDTNLLLETMFRHTSTLGIRIHDHMKRAALRRSFLSVQTPFSDIPIHVKVGYLGKEILSVKAEYDDCARISRDSKVPIQQVADSATQQAHVQLRETSKIDSTVNT